MLCEVCEDQEAKYRCPGCMSRTCCLQCVQAHKRERNCSGVRSKTDFVPISEFSNTNLLSDYRMLEETGRISNNASRDMVQSIRGKQKANRMKSVARKARQRNIQLRTLPYAMSRAVQNSTRLAYQQLLWLTEWVFTADGLTEYIRVIEDKTLGEGLLLLIHPNKSEPMRRHRLRRYVQQLTLISTEEATAHIDEKESERKMAIEEAKTIPSAASESVEQGKPGEHGQIPDKGLAVIELTQDMSTEQSINVQHVSDASTKSIQQVQNPSAEQTQTIQNASTEQTQAIQDAFTEQTQTMQDATVEQTQTIQDAFTEQTQTMQDASAEQTQTMQDATVEQTQTIQNASAEQTQTIQDASSEQTQTMQDASAEQTQTMQDASAEQTQTIQDASADQTQTMQDASVEQTQTMQDASVEQTQTLQGASLEKTQNESAPVNESQDTDRSLMSKLEPLHFKNDEMCKTSEKLEIIFREKESYKSLSTNGPETVNKHLINGVVQEHESELDIPDTSCQYEHTTDKQQGCLPSETGMHAEKLDMSQNEDSEEMPDEIKTIKSHKPIHNLNNSYPNTEGTTNETAIKQVGVSQNEDEDEMPEEMQIVKDDAPVEKAGLKKGLGHKKEVEKKEKFDFGDIGVFMKVQNRPANDVRYFQLDLNATLTDNLRERTVIEFPTFHVALRDSWHNFPLP